MDYSKIRSSIVFLLMLSLTFIISGCDNLSEDTNATKYDASKLVSENGWTRIDDNIIVVTDENSSDVNITLLIDSNKIAIIDTGSVKSKEQIQKISQYIKDNDLILTDLFITHGHQDHTANIDILIDDNTNVHRYDNKQDGEIIEFGDNELKIIYTSGHSFDHMSIELVNENILIAGDVLVTNALPALGGNSFDLISTFEMIRENEYDLIIPGHGYIIDSELAINRHLDYLNNVNTLVKEAIESDKEQSDLVNIDVWDCIDLDESIRKDYWIDGHDSIVQRVYYEIKYELNENK